MTGCRTWSYTPYRPLLTNVGDIYICRIAPTAHKIHFEWLDSDDNEYSVFFRRRGEGNFLLAGKTGKKNLI